MLSDHEGGIQVSEERVTMTIKQGPHSGWWIMEGEKVVLWCYSEELAKLRLEELNAISR